MSSSRSFSRNHSAGQFAAFGLALLSFAASAALGQNTDQSWQKSYSVSGKPTLTIETSDSGLEIHSCGDCKEIRIHVRTGGSLNKYELEEYQDRDHVSFSLKEKPHVGLTIHWKPTGGTQVSVETPASLGLDAKVADGNLAARGLSGEIQIHAGHGTVNLDDMSGSLHLVSSDGNIDIHHASGTLDARASDGHMKIDGQFSSVQLHTSDGDLDFALAPGSQLMEASRIESSDGKISIRLPQNLAADVDVSSSDGHIDCALPLTMDHYSNAGSGHHLHGHLNSGGVPLSIHTSDGNVSIAAL